MTTINLSPAQLAKRWDTSPGHLANLRSQGRGLPYVKIGSRVLYRLIDVEEYERRSLVQPVAA